MVAGVAAYVATSGGGGPAPAPAASTRTTTTISHRTTTTIAARTASAPHVLVRAPAALSATWTAAAKVHGQDAVWVAQRAGVVLMRLNQALVHLTLHAGSADGGVSGWTYGDQISRAEIHLVIAAFNGGFKFTYPGGGVGFASGGHVALPLSAGLGSLVTYTDGTSNVGSWDSGVPTRRKTVFSVLQNERLLVDRGIAAPTVASCIITCWGATIGGATAVARSAIGITADGQIVWAAGEQLTPADLANALIAAGAVRAIELDINPDWVAGYLYVHHSSGPSATPVIPGQIGLAGQLLAPYSRDFIAVVAN